MQLVQQAYTGSRNVRTTTDKYIFTPTAQILQPLFDAGFHIVDSKSASKSVYGKHFFKLEHAKLPQCGQRKIQIIGRNAHDGSSSLFLTAGVFEFACYNGLVIGHSFGYFKKPHRGRIDDFINGVWEVVDRAQQVPQLIHKLEDTYLNKDRAEEFATRAAALRPVARPDQLLIPNRTDDVSFSLWKIFNTIQENLLKGRFNTPSNRPGIPIRSAARDYDLNTKLWNLAEEYAQQ